MVHIHTQPGQYDHTVTAYIVRMDGPEPRVLLHMHRKLHMLLPVGGHIELDETPWQAMAHEIQEESGYALSDLELLQPKTRITRLDRVVLHPYPVVQNTHEITDDHSHSDTAYAFVTRSENGELADISESADIRWLTRTELDALDPSVIYQNTKQVYQFILDTCLEEWEAVSTATYAQN